MTDSASGTGAVDRASAGKGPVVAGVIAIALLKLQSARLVDAVTINPRNCRSIRSADI
jgi:hypothetical protein